MDLVDEGTLNLDDLVIYIGGRFGEDAGASFIEISTVGKLFERRDKLK